MGVLGGSGIGDDGVSALACWLSKYRMDLMLHGAAQLIIIHVFFCPTSGDEDFQRRGLQRSTAYVEDHKSYAVISSVLISHFSPPLPTGLSLLYIMLCVFRQAQWHLLLRAGTTRTPQHKRDSLVSLVFWWLCGI